MFLSHIFNSADKLRKERVRDARDQHANGKTALSAEAAGQEIRMVIELRDSGAHPEAGPLGNTRFIIDDCGDGLDGDVGKLSDVIHGDPGRHWRGELHGLKREHEASCERSCKPD